MKCNFHTKRPIYKGNLLKGCLFICLNGSIFNFIAQVQLNHRYSLFSYKQR